MNKFSIILLILLSVTLLINCNNDKKQKINSESNNIKEKLIKKRKLDYEIVYKDVNETKSKAQVIMYVVYNDTIFNKDALSDVLLEVYFRNRKSDVFKNFDEPTVVGVYVFTSKEQIETDKSSWISMLIKSPNDESPKLSYNEMKLKSLAVLNDKVKSRDEITLDGLNIYLEKKDLTLCKLYKEFSKYELENIHKADSKYPNFGKEHSDFITELDKADRKRIVSKYMLADSIYTLTIVFGPIYCK
jgi:hypothetical protein